MTEQIAHVITERVIARSHLFLDMHGGDAPEDLMPYAAYYAHDSMHQASAKGKEMAISLGFDHLIVFNTNGKDYLKPDQPSLYCSAEAFKRNIPSIDIECGRLGSADPLRIDKIEASVLSLLRHLKMLPEIAPPLPARSPRLITDRAYLSSQHSGIFYPAKRAGNYVSTGIKTGHMTNYFGEELNGSPRSKKHQGGAFPLFSSCQKLGLLVKPPAIPNKYRNAFGSFEPPSLPRRAVPANGK